MHLLNPPRISALSNNIVVELVPESQGRQTGAREISDRRQEESIDGAANEEDAGYYCDYEG